MPVVFNNSFAQSSNKPPLQLIAYDSTAEFVALKPKIDRISFTVDIEKKDQAAISSNLKEVSAENGHLKRVRAAGRYALRFRLTDLASGQAILIEAVPVSQKKKLAFLRLELNPEHWGKAWRKMLSDAFLPLLLAKYNWSYIAANAKVTQLDVAVDLLGVGAGKLLVEDPKGKPTKRMIYVGDDGLLETIYPNEKTKGTKAYDKLKQLVAAGVTHEFDQTPLTRIETRLRPNRSFAGLLKIKNPFLKLVVRDASRAIEPPESPHSWSFFLTSSQFKGTRHTLDAIADPVTRKAYVAALSSADRNVWRPATLWAHWGWSMKRAGLILNK